MALPLDGATVFFVVGLLGGAHCLGMCGPLVTIYADRLREDRGPLTWFEIRQHALLNAGRTVSYTAIGAAAGFVGSVLFDAGDLLAVGTYVRATAGLAAGALIAAAGIGYALGGSTARHPGSGLTGSAFARVSTWLTARVDGWVGGPRIVALGALHGLLPCPILYPAFLYAFAAGSPVDGGVSLFALGLGTFPALFLYGTLFGSLSAGRRRPLHRALGVAFVVLGYASFSHGLMALGIEVPRLPLPYAAAP